MCPPSSPARSASCRAEWLTCSMPAVSSSEEAATFWLAAAVCSAVAAMV